MWIVVVSYFIFGKSCDNILKYNIVAGLGEYVIDYKKLLIAISLCHISHLLLQSNVTPTLSPPFFSIPFILIHSFTSPHLTSPPFTRRRNICLPLPPPPPPNLPQFPAKPYVSPGPVASSLLGWLSSSWRKAIPFEEPCETQVQQIFYLIP